MMQGSLDFMVSPCSSHDWELRREIFYVIMETFFFIFSMRLHSVVLVILKISNHLETHLDALKPRKISLQTWCFDAVVMNFVIIHLMPQRHFSSFVAEKSFFSPLFTTTTQHIEILITIKLYNRIVKRPKKVLMLSCDLRLQWKAISQHFIAASESPKTVC